jgi:hypothetical protein
MHGHSNIKFDKRILDTTLYVVDNSNVPRYLITGSFIAALTNKHNSTSHYQSKFTLLELEVLSLQAMDGACGTNGLNINARWVLVGNYVGN